MLVFIDFMSGGVIERRLITHLENNIPSLQLAEALNSLLAAPPVSSQNITFPQHYHLVPGDLPIRGLQWARKYHTHEWFIAKLKKMSKIITY